MRYLALLSLVVGCTTLHQPPVTDPVVHARRRVIARDLAWAMDSTPVVRFNPPLIYGSWRLAIESCSGKTRLGWPKFYIAPVNPIGPGWTAYYASTTQSIVFGLGSETDAGIVMHELLHWLLDPVSGHPEDFFGDGVEPGKCGALLARR